MQPHSSSKSEKQCRRFAVAEPSLNRRSDALEQRAILKVRPREPNSNALIGSNQISSERKDS